MASLRSASCHGNSSSHAAARTFAHTNNTNPLELLSQAALEDELSEASSSLSSSAAAVVAARNNHRRSLVPALERRHSLPTLLLSNSSNRRRKSSLHQSQGMDGMEEEAPLPEDAPFSSHHPADPNHQMVAMPADFVPGPYDVLCGRGRACKVAAGNLAYRDLIVTYLEVYGAADSKLQKGAILTDIMNRVRDLCHTYHQRQERHEKKKNAATGKNSTDTTSTTTTANSSPVLGGFVKCINGTWYEVGDFLAREKTSQCFRDALASHYSSSAQSKYLRRRARETTPNAPSATADGNSSSVSTSTNENPPGDSTSSYRQNDKGSLDDEVRNEYSVSRFMLLYRIE